MTELSFKHYPQVAPDRSSSISRIIHSWFDEKSQASIVSEDRTKTAPYDYLAFLRETQLLTKTIGLPTEDGTGWDVDHIFDASEALAFHGFVQWLMWHVSSLGVLPVWMSAPTEMRDRYEAWLATGLPAAFAMSEKAAGADWRKTRTILTTRAEGVLTLHGEKNYAGNAQFSPMVSTFVVDTADKEPSFAFVRTSAGRPGYTVRKNAVPEQMYVCDFTLTDYRVPNEDVISRGPQAFRDAVNTINIGKVNLATAALGLHSRMLLETFAHLERRTIFKTRTSEFGQNREIISRAIARNAAMRCYLEGCRRAMRRASQRDESYIVLNSMAKALVTELLERSVTELTDAASAFSFEIDSPVYALRKYISYLPRLEGTKYVNLAQTLKSAKTYVARRRLHADSTGTSDGSFSIGRDYLLSPRGLGGFRQNVGSAPVERREDIDFDKTSHPVLEVMEVIEEWIHHTSLSMPTSNQATNQALGEVYGWLVIATTLIDTEDSVYFLESHLGVVGDELLRVLSSRRSILRSVDFPVSKCVSLLLATGSAPTFDLEAARHSATIHRTSLWNPDGGIVQ
ncbi:acyl-CoA dehydrogenase family protein [Corynebacterium sp.]|uniref:acyl-CoA dehydrogenase family protein n=1 Tax=Corynebacterium sp. TaxID=1720 RepID=UPI0026DD4F5D|nr:acyl-CoA dehydrogenase family protein [Corynebacterium sp.]MDO4609276.1 acyl-CoA dehydrogenase family protein [Corynebacterium sp.]